MSGSTIFTTSVPGPAFGPNGVVLPPENDVLTGVQTDINGALGGNINPQLTSPQGQIATTETAAIGDSQALFAWFCNQIDPAYNSGRMQDGIGRIYFMTRIAAAPTVQPCVCAGLDGVVIQIGNLANDPSTNLLWLAQESGEIQGGSVTINFACAQTNPIAVAPQTLEIFQGPFGWESVVPTGDAVLGNLVESPAQYEQRRQNSVAANASQVLDAIQGLVLGLPGVLDAYCYDNATGTNVTVGGVTINARSIYVCVLGGISTAVANAIWTKKAPGCGYTGNTVETITDTNPAYNPPAPTYLVAYQIPTITAFAVVVTLLNNSGIPANALSLIQAPIINAFAGLDGGSRAKIGSTIFASRYYAGVIALGPWAQIVSIKIGLLGTAWTGNAAIAGTALTVNSTLSGVLATGQLLQDSSGVLASGTMIVSGSGTSWVVSITQTVSAENMTGTTLVDDVTVNINQAPSVSANNINLVIQ